MNRHFSQKPPRRSRIYPIYAGVFVLLVVGYIGAIAYFAGFEPRAGWASVLFALLLLMLGGALVRTLKREAADEMDTLHSIMDEALSGGTRRMDYADTPLSSFEQKILRYIELSSMQEQKLAAEQDSMKALISDISHQTKTPLSNIILYSGLLEEVPELRDEARQYVASIKEQSAKLDWLIRSLVNLSRLETGMIAIQAVSAPLVPTLTRSVSQMYGKAEEKGIGIEVACLPGVTACHDPKWTAEALFNLLENAVKYSEPGGSITITARAGEMFVRIDIADTGIGIEESEWAAVFRRFYRSPRTARYEGVGLGLYLTRQILTAQGGYIKVSSVPGEGSVFSVFLPVECGR